MKKRLLSVDGIMLTDGHSVRAGLSQATEYLAIQRGDAWVAGTVWAGEDKICTRHVSKDNSPISQHAT
jgi:hypothetical protein